MTKNELTEVIRKLVSEELQKQFPSLLAEVLNGTKTPHKKTMVEQKKVVPPVQRPRVEVKTGNPQLDRTLQETTAGFAGQSYEGPGVAMDGDIGLIGEGVEIPDMSYEQIGDEVVDVIQASPLPSFLKRDYSSILKKSDKLASSYRGSPKPL